MNRTLGAVAVAVSVMACTAWADMSRPKTKDLFRTQEIESASGYRSPRSIGDVRDWQRLSLERPTELEMQWRSSQEGRASLATGVREEDRKAWIGLRTRKLDSQLAKHFGVDRGLLVAEVIDRGPARKAGIKAGDVIIEADSRAVHTNDDLAELIDCCGPGKKVSVTLLRKGKQLRKEVRLASAPRNI